MKRAIQAGVVFAILAITLFGCEGFLPVPKTEMEQVEGFLLAASVEPQVPATMKSYFDPSTAQYVSMELPTYWETTFFVEGEGPFSLLNGAIGGADPDFPGSVTITGNVTNTIVPDTGYPAEFVLITDDTQLFADPLIRKITVTVADTPEIIEKVIP